MDQNFTPPPTDTVKETIEKAGGISQEKFEALKSEPEGTELKQESNQSNFLEGVRQARAERDKQLVIDSYKLDIRGAEALLAVAMSIDSLVSPEERKGMKSIVLEDYGKAVEKLRNLLGEENFEPILQSIHIKNMDEAVELLNSTNLAFTQDAIGQDIKKYVELYKEKVKENKIRMEEQHKMNLSKKDLTEENKKKLENLILQQREKTKKLYDEYSAAA